MSVIPIRRPQFTRRGMLHLVQQIANEIAAANLGKIPDIFSIDVRLRERLVGNPELIDLDLYCRRLRQFWEKANNQTISGKQGSNLFVPGAYVTLGKKRRGRMDALEPLVEVNLWRQQDEEIIANFTSTMKRRREYQLQVMAEATVNRDCATLGDLEAKLRGYVPTSADDNPFNEQSDEEDE